MEKSAFIKQFVAGIMVIMPAFLLTVVFAGDDLRTGQQTRNSLSDDETTALVISHGETRGDAASTLSFFDERDVVMRFRPIDLNPVVTSTKEVRDGDLLTLNLFDDVSLEAEITRAYSNVNDTWSIIGHVVDDDAYFTFVTTRARSLGSIYLPKENKYYKIISDSDGRQHYVIEMDAHDRDILESSPPLIPEGIEPDPAEQKRIRETIREKDLGPDDWATIGVMIVYTPNAETWGNVSGGGIENVVAMAMSNAQLVLDNSEARAVMRLVHSARVQFNESGGGGQVLRSFTASPDYNPFGGNYGDDMPIVHQWRDKYGADLSAIFARVSDTGGVAWQLNDRNGMPRLGFSLTRVQQAADGYTHIHEMGHNMGLHHHMDQNFQPGPTDWSNWPENNWSAGWRWTGDNGGHYCSVMTYTGGQYYSDGTDHTEVPYFSNPEASHQGVPAGHHQFGNNTLTLQTTKHVVASYRPGDLPVMFTKDVRDITTTSAVSGGVIADENAAVSTKGILWSSERVPVMDDHEGMTDDGPGTEEFESVLDNLIPSTNYFVTAYAITNDGISYAPHQEFRTESAYRPTVYTVQSTRVTHHTAISGGNVTSDGNMPVSERGVVWSQHSNPTITDNEGFSLDGEGVGEYESEMTGLRPETTYFYRSYATNVMGTRYGELYELTTLAAQVYPNPASDRLFVEFINDSDQEAVVRLQTLDGKLVKKRTFNQTGEISTFFETTMLRGGLYILSIHGDYDFPSYKIMISPDR